MRKKIQNYAFIDSQNLNLSIRSQGWVLDFKRFRKYLSDKYHAVKAFLFIGYVPGNESLYSSLQQFGYILIFKPTLELPNDTVKGNVDAELVLHAMIEYQNYHQAIIISGDGDFHCLIEYLEEQGKLAHLLIPNRKRYSSLYRKHMTKISFLNSLKKKLGYKNNLHFKGKRKIKAQKKREKH
ncbi:MAG: NYN domain-containing protein [Patescibacteria group bacterium]